MPKPKRVGDLEITQNLAHERLEWRIERVGWMIMALILLAALLGLLGPGPLSRATAGERGSTLWVAYNRFERYQTPATPRVHLGPEAARGGKARLWLTREFVENIELRHITDSPVALLHTYWSGAFAFRRALCSFLYALPFADMVDEPGGAVSLSLVLLQISGHPALQLFSLCTHRLGLSQHFLAPG